MVVFAHNCMPIGCVELPMVLREGHCQRITSKWSALLANRKRPG